MYTISLMELVVCLAEIVDLMGEEIRNHHKRVACGAFMLADACGVTGEAKRELVIAAALHDIGGFTLEARVCAALHFEDTNAHAEKGYKLLCPFAPFHNIANTIRYHHAPWSYGNGRQADGSPLPAASQIVLLADRIAVMLLPGILTLTETAAVTGKIFEQSGKMFDPALLEIFKQVSQKDVFWLNFTSQSFYDSIISELKTHDVVFEGDSLKGMLELLSNIIDFKSVFTMMHSKGVAAVAEMLSVQLGLPEDDRYAILVAAMLHDIGKLAIPGEILDKPGPLTPRERSIIRTHAFFTDRVLGNLKGFSKVQKLASLHHESLNGHGYPFGFEQEDAELTLGAKIMKVADVFVALIEDRPYRKGMQFEEALGILQDMVDKNEVEADVVSCLAANKDEIGRLCHDAEAKAAEEYKAFCEGLPQE